ncbi:hypothetical protein WA026_016436 [Henosepilachna vigintioctopunctata]|uniref:Uncharacterized protein n=1 Tax=Henosepilachna vigintioctopunctata TaxID=420089 RepID=A0AAW1ULB1_9CUCU
MELHHVIVLLVIILLWANLASVQGRKRDDMPRAFRRSADASERRTRKFDEMVLATARGYGKRANERFKDNSLLEWIGLERMRGLGYPTRVMSNSEMISE